jgi:hypothetical protein
MSLKVVIWICPKKLPFFAMVLILERGMQIKEVEIERIFLVSQINSI